MRLPSRQAPRYRRPVSDHQPIYVVSTGASDQDVARLRGRLGKRAVVLTAPTAEARRVVEPLVSGLGAKPRPEVELAPVRFPDVDRGHRLDDLVRTHAVHDRFRDVVVVADPATVTLLLRVLAPDQLPESGPVTRVGLPRGDRPVPFVPTLVAGVLLALVAGLMATVLPWWLVPLLVVVAGLVLLVVPGQRTTGLTVLAASGVAAVVGFLGIAGSSRFPGSW